MKRATLNETVGAIISKFLESEGFEMYELTINRGKRRFLVQITIDGPDGVTIDDCARVSKTLSPLLDAEDPFPGSYTLEVSSPGINRKLLKPEHFVRYQGERAKIKLASGTITGILGGMDGATLLLTPDTGVDGDPVRVPYGQILSAQLDVDLTQALKKKRS